MSPKWTDGTTACPFWESGSPDDRSGSLDDGAPRHHPLFICENVSWRFGGPVAVDDVSLLLDSGDLVGVIGPNGFGKASFSNCITGFTPPSECWVQFDGEDIPGMKPLMVADGVAGAPSWASSTSAGGRTVPGACPDTRRAEIRHDPPNPWKRVWHFAGGAERQSRLVRGGRCPHHGCRADYPRGQGCRSPP